MSNSVKTGLVSAVNHPVLTVNYPALAPNTTLGEISLKQLSSLTLNTSDFFSVTSLSLSKILVSLSV